MSPGEKVGIGIAAIGGFIAFLAAAPIMMGFGSAGIVGGSIAAGI